MMINEQNLFANTHFLCRNFQPFEVRPMEIERDERTPKACVCFLPYHMKVPTAASICEAS